MEADILRLGLAQISPIWLNKNATINKLVDYIETASNKNCDIVAFGEAILPGYPYWLELTNGAKFNSKIQKEIYSHYLHEAINIDAGDLNQLCKTAKSKNISVIVGCIEKAQDRGGHSLYCSLVYINKDGVIKSVHRKLVPTYEERLVWANGDGNGLQVHKLGAFTIGGLNCWENWMPLSRSALYGQGEDLHFAIWPGGLHNTKDITQFIAKESRSFVVSVSGLMKKEDITEDIPHSDLIIKNCPDIVSNGGSCLASPNGEWIVEPVIDKEELIIAEIDHSLVREERQNFDPAGHYSRPDVTSLNVNRQRQSIVNLND